MMSIILQEVVVNQNWDEEIQNIMQLLDKKEHSKIKNHETKQTLITFKYKLMQAMRKIEESGKHVHYSN